MEATKSRPGAGLFALVIKLGLKFGAKLLSVALKLLKGLKLGKLGMATASFGAYALLFSWQFAVVLIASLVFHEMGHLWAMRRFGMKTRGLYLIPLLGAAAVADDAFPSRKAESVIALMGPCWGLVMALATAGIYLATGSPLVAALAGWMAMLNLFNLLPINPLDGGRLMKSVAYSISSGAGYAFMAIGLVLAFAAAMYLSLGLFTFLLVIGVIELLGERKRMRQARDREKIIAALSGALGVPADTAGISERILRTHRLLLGGNWAVFPPGLLDENPYTGRFDAREWAEHFHARIDRVVLDACPTYPRLFGLIKGRKHETLPINVALLTVTTYSPLIEYLAQKEPMPRMSPKEVALAFVAYVALGAALVGLMFAMSHVPAANAALQVFMS